jgi:hypothetical protein
MKYEWDMKFIMGEVKNVAPDQDQPNFATLRKQILGADPITGDPCGLQVSGFKSGKNHDKALPSEVWARQVGYRGCRWLPMSWAPGLWQMSSRKGYSKGNCAHSH